MMKTCKNLSAVECEEERTGLASQSQLKVELPTHNELSEEILFGNFDQFFLNEYTQKQIERMTVDEFIQCRASSASRYKIWCENAERRNAIVSPPVAKAQMNTVVKCEDAKLPCQYGFLSGINAGSDLILQGMGKIADYEVQGVALLVKPFLCMLQSDCSCDQCFKLTAEALVYPTNMGLVWNRILDHHVIRGKDGSIGTVDTKIIDSSQFLLVVVLGEFVRHKFNASSIRDSLLKMLPQSFSILISNFFPKAAPVEVEAQSNYIWEGLASLIKTWTPSSTLTKEDFHQAASFAKDMSSIQNFTQRTVLFVTSLTDRLMKLLAGATLNVSREVANWIQKVEDLSLQPVSLSKMGEPDGVFLSLSKRMASWPKLREDVYTLYKEGNSLYHKYVLIDPKSSEVGLLLKYKTELKKIIADNSASYMGSEGKNKPVFIVLYGEPGMGKTVCVDHLMRDLFAVRGEATYNSSLDKYSYNPCSEYFEGYNYQKVFEVSDFMQIRDKQARINELMNILHVSDESAYCLNTAFESKGTIYFHSKYIILTSNLHPHEREGAIGDVIEYPEAFYRRINVMAEVHNTVNTGVFDKDSMSFQVSALASDQNSGTTDMKWNEFVAYLTNVTDTVTEQSTNVRDTELAFSEDRVKKIKELIGSKVDFSQPPNVNKDTVFKLTVSCIANPDGKGDCAGCAHFVERHRGMLRGRHRLSRDHSGIIHPCGSTEVHRCNRRCMPVAEAQSLDHLQQFDITAARELVNKHLDGISSTRLNQLIEQQIFDEIARELMIPVFTGDGLSFFPKNPKFRGYLLVKTKRVSDSEGIVVIRASCEWKWYNMDYISGFFDSVTCKAKNYKALIVEWLDAVVVTRADTVWSYISPNKIKERIRNMAIRVGLDEAIAFFKKIVLPALVGLISLIGMVKLWSWVFSEQPKECTVPFEEIEMTEFRPPTPEVEVSASDTTGLGHRPRVPRRARVKTRMNLSFDDLSASIKKGEAYMMDFDDQVVAALSSEVTAMEIAIHNIRPNVGLVSTSCGTTNVVALRDKYVVIPEHVISDTKDDRITMTFPGGRSFSFLYTEVKAVRSSANHLIAINLGTIPKFNRMPSFSNIVKYFAKGSLKEVPDGFLMVAGQIGTSLGYVLKFADRILPDVQGTNLTSGHREFVIPECYVYRCPTRDGDCGAPLMTVIDGRPVILGLHIGMNVPERLCYSARLTVGWWDNVMMPEMTNRAQIKPIITEFPSVVSYLEEKGPYVFQPRVTKLVKSDLWVEDCLFKPAPLKGYFQGDTPLQKAFEKSLRPIVVPPEEQFYDAVNELSEIYARPDSYPNDVLTVEQAVFGVDNIPGMNSTGGVGIPWSEQYKRKELFSYEVYSISAELRDKCMTNMDELRKGNRLHYIIADMAKDEKLPREKADAGKCRLFFMLPLDINITCKQIFGRFAQFVIDRHTIAPVKVGHASCADDVRKMAHYLKLQDDQLKYLTPDTAASDRSIPYGIFMQVVELTNEWYGDDNNKLRGMMAESIFCSVHVLGQMKYETRAGMPSGFYLTSVFNSLAYYIAYSSCMKQLRVHIVAIATFGDDVVMAIDKREKVTEQQITEQCKKIGLDITGVKKDEPLTFCEAKDVVFLQRKFVKREGVWYSPIDLERIQHQIMWYRRTTETRTWSKARIHEEIMRNAFHEFYQHGQEVFEAMLVKYSGLIASYDIYVPDFLHHHECYTAAGARHVIYDDEHNPTFGEHDDYFGVVQAGGKKLPPGGETRVVYPERRVNRSTTSKKVPVPTAELTQYSESGDEDESVEVQIDEDDSSGVDSLTDVDSSGIGLSVGTLDSVSSIPVKTVNEQRIEIIQNVNASLTDSTVDHGIKQGTLASIFVDDRFKKFFSRDKIVTADQITVGYLLELEEEIKGLQVPVGAVKPVVKEAEVEEETQPLKKEGWWDWVVRKCKELWEFVKRKFNQFKNWCTGSFSVEDCKMGIKFKKLKERIALLKEDEDVETLNTLLEEVEALRGAAVGRAGALAQSMFEDVDGEKQSWYEWLGAKLAFFIKRFSMAREIKRRRELTNNLIEVVITKRTAAHVLTQVHKLHETCDKLEKKKEWSIVKHLGVNIVSGVSAAVIVVGVSTGIRHFFPESFLAQIPVGKFLFPLVYTGAVSSLDDIAKYSGNDFFMHVDHFSKKMSGVSICNFVLGGISFALYENTMFLFGHGLPVTRWAALNPANTVVAPILEEVAFSHPAHKLVFGVCEAIFHVSKGVDPVHRVPALLCHSALAACAYCEVGLLARILTHSAFNVIAGQVVVSLQTPEEREDFKQSMIEHYMQHGTPEQVAMLHEASASFFSQFKESVNWITVITALLFAFGMAGVGSLISYSRSEENVEETKKKEKKEEEKTEDDRVCVLSAGPHVLSGVCQMNNGDIVQDTNIGDAETAVTDANLTRFVEVTPIQAACVPSREFPIVDSGFEWSRAYCEELERLVPVDTYTMQGFPTATPRRYNPIMNILNEEYIANRFYQAIGARFDLEYEIRLVVTKFHYGQIMAVVRPGFYQTQNDLTGNFNGTLVTIRQQEWGGYDSIYTASQCEHSVIPLTKGSPTTLCARWHYPYNWVYTLSPGCDIAKAKPKGDIPRERLNNLMKFGVLDIYNLTGAWPVDMMKPKVCIWVRFKNLRLFGYNNHIPKISQMLFKTPASIAIGQMGEAQELAQDSWSSSIRSTVSGVVSTVTGFVQSFTSVMAMFGLSNPRREGGPTPMVLVQYPTATSYGDSPAISLSYRMDDKQPSILDEQGKKELMISELCAKETFFGYHTFSNAKAMYKFSINMNTSHPYGNGVIYSPAAYLKRFFKLARADLKVKFHFSASAVVDARMFITAIPIVTQGFQDEVNSTYRVSASPDVSGDVIFEMDLPYMKETQYSEEGPEWNITVGLYTDIVSIEEAEVKPVAMTVWYSFPNAQMAIASTPQITDHSTFQVYLPAYRKRVTRVSRDIRETEVNVGPVAHEHGMLPDSDSQPSVGQSKMPMTGTAVHDSVQGLNCSPTSILHMMKRFSTISVSGTGTTSLRPMRPWWGSVKIRGGSDPLFLNYAYGGVFHMLLLMFKYVHGGTNVVCLDKNTTQPMVSEAAFIAGDAQETPIKDITDKMVTAGGYMFEKGDVKGIYHVPYRASTPFSFVELPVYSKPLYSSEKPEWMVNCSNSQYPVLSNAKRLCISAADDLEPFLFVGIPCTTTQNVT